MTARQDDWAERWGRRAPALIAAYVAALAALRLSLSPFLEVDEAHFVGLTDLSLAYGDSHPPLYAWLMRAALEITFWHWAAAAALVKFPLLAAFHLLSWDAARRLGGARAGLLAVAASAFLPQIVWMSALTLTHSALVMASAAAVIHASALLFQRRDLPRYLWLGAAMAAGLMSKYNFPLFLGPFLIALFATPGTRPILTDRRALAAFGLCAALITPAYAAAALDAAGTTGRVVKLFSLQGATAGLDVPGIGLDGFLSLLQAIAAWAGPAALIWWAARRAPPPPQAQGGAMAEALGRAMVLGLVVFALVVLAGDMHRVRERYITPILAPLPIWLALARPFAARWPAALAAAVYLAAMAGVWGVVQFSPNRLAYPYDEIAAGLTRAFPEAAHVAGLREADGANLALATGLEFAHPDKPWPDGPVIAAWRGVGPIPEAFAARLPDGAAPAPVRLSALATNRSGATIGFSAVLIP